MTTKVAHVVDVVSKLIERAVAPGFTESEARTAAHEACKLIDKNRLTLVPPSDVPDEEGRGPDSGPRDSTPRPSSSVEDGEGEPISLLRAKSDAEASSSLEGARAGRARAAKVRGKR